jgi:maleylacetoacetate isomerase
MKLHSYFRSSASYRVRIALNLKGLPYELVPVHLLKDGGEQHTESFRALNPDALVPVLENEGVALTQSLAIIEYLEETYPTPALLATNAIDRAWQRSVALMIACDIHPINNLRILQYLTNDLHVSEEDKNKWYRHWCEQGLAAIERMLVNDVRVGRYCYGDSPSLADCFLIPQIANAKRLQCNLTDMPTLLRINDACLQLDAFIHASPAQQPDAE